MNVPRVPRILFISLFLFITLASCKSKVPTLADLADTTGIKFPGTSDFVIEKDISRQGKTGTFRTIKAARGQEQLKIEIISPIDLTDVRKNIEERFNIINSLYTNLPSPYPGMVTKNIEYPQELRPEYQLVDTPSQTLPLYFLASNDRYIYGVMAEELIAFKGFLTFVYNPANKSLARLDFFTPKAQFSKEQALRFVQGITFTKDIKKINLAAATPKDPITTAEVQKPLARVENATQLQDNLNVIVIGFEPLGANHIGCYGYAKNTTPSLDAFAKDAFLFERVISPSSWTLPVFMSWFTALYPSQHKITNKYWEITKTEQKISTLSEQAPNVVTLAEVLKGYGYQTAGFTGSAGVSSDFGYGRGFDTYYDKKTFAGFDETMPMAIDWLKNNGSKKFFLFVQGYDVHGRFPMDEEGKAKFLYKGYQGPLQGTIDEYWDLRNKNIDQGRIDLSPEDIKFLESVYDAKISAADKRFGQFIQQLKEMNFLKNSIIVISSGSGNEYYEHKRIDHGFSLYNELIRVPLIIRMPERGGSTKDLASTIDIMPTILDILKIKDPKAEKQMQGVSLQPLLAGKSSALDGFSETDYLMQSFKRAITTNDDWKFIISLDTDARELYDLKKDPLETTNVIEQNGKMAYELEQKLFKHLQVISGK
ncbi:MAG: sulfatase [Pseudomonadota bacterium]